MAKRRLKNEPQAETPDETADNKYSDNEYSLSEKAIAALTTKKVFARGEELLEIGAILDATGEEVSNSLILRALCCGSETEPYRVRALLDASVVQETQCNCPYDYECICKHIVALLLLDARAPDSIPILPPLDEIFEDLDRDDLRTLLSELAARDPQITVALHQFRMTKLVGEDADAGSTLPGAAGLRSRARGLIHGSVQSAIHSWQWEHDDGDAPRRLIRNLEKLLGESRLQAIATQDTKCNCLAGLLHEAVLHEIVAAYHEALHMLDEDNQITQFADDCAQELQRCLKHVAGDRQHASLCDNWKKTLQIYQRLF